VAPSGHLCLVISCKQNVFYKTAQAAGVIDNRLQYWNWAIKVQKKDLAQKL